LDLCNRFVWSFLSIYFIFETLEIWCHVRLLVASANAWSATTFAGRIDPGEARLEDIAGLSSDVIGGFKFNQFAELSAEAVYDFKLDWFDA
jgi:hypothetical protein